MLASSARLMAGVAISAAAMKLKQAGIAEQIEIGGINMMLIGKALAGLSATRPSIFDAGQTSVVESNRSPSQFLRTQDVGVPECDSAEYRYWSRDPPG